MLNKDLKNALRKRKKKKPQRKEKKEAVENDELNNKVNEKKGHRLPSRQ